MITELDLRGLAAGVWAVFFAVFVLLMLWDWFRHGRSAVQTSAREGGMGDTVWVDVLVTQVTSRAVEVDTCMPQSRPAWVPASQIVDHDGELAVGEHIMIELPVWLAEAKGLV